MTTAFGLASELNINDLIADFAQAIDQSKE